MRDSESSDEPSKDSVNSDDVGDEGGGEDKEESQGPAKRKEEGQDASRREESREGDERETDSHHERSRMSILDRSRLDGEVVENLPKRPTADLGQAKKRNEEGKSVDDAPVRKFDSIRDCTHDSPPDSAKQDVHSVDSRSTSSSGGVDESDGQSEQDPTDNIVSNSS